MKKTIWPVLVLALLPGTLFAQSFSGSAKGTTAADFLQLGVGGRAMGMGGAFSAIADDASALYWNPAGLTNIEKRSATFMHASYLQSSFFDYAAYGQNLGKYGAAGGSLQYLNAGQITQTDANFNPIGTFSPYDMALTFGYAHKLTGVAPALDGAAVGGSIKYIRSAIINTAQTTAFDVGMLSPFYFNHKLRLAFTMTNLGGTLKYEQTAENLPLTMTAGGAYHITDRWLTSLDLGIPRGNSPYVAAGTEYLFPLKDTWSFAGRLGYNSRNVGDVSGVTGVSVGVGLGAHGLNFDYSFVPYGSLGITNRFSVSAKF
ncbi:MAG: PorV/PorQ family protein [Elusimicrobia bacterium]|nr:PorV/PorQ family protein [Elusimicrobiota bacterium]